MNVSPPTTASPTSTGRPFFAVGAAPPRIGEVTSGRYVHGGAWRAGSRGDVPILGLLEHGHAIASVDYRLSTQARFPAQIHDIKAGMQVGR